MVSYDDVLEEVKYFSEYSKRFKCDSCGAPSIDTCGWCGTKVTKQSTIDEVNKFRARLTEIFKSLPQDVYCNDTLNYIYKMKDLSFIAEYLSEIKYEEVLNDEWCKLIEKVNKNENLDSNEVKNFEFITLNKLDRSELKKYNAYILRKVITGEVDFSYHYFELFMTDLIFTVMKDSGVQGIPSIEDLDNLHGAVVNKLFLKIDRTDIKNLYEHKDLEALVTLYHETQHLIQDNMYKDYQHPNIFVLQMLKEQILSKFYHEDYYQKNYNKLLFELDAEMVGLVSTVQLAERIGLEFNERLSKKFQSDIQSVAERVKDPLREFCGEIKSVNEIFDEFVIDKPELLDVYPYLQYQYKKEDDMTVAKKTPEEVLDGVGNVDFSTLTQEQREYMNIFFKVLCDPNLVTKKLAPQDTSSPKKV